MRFLVSWFLGFSGLYIMGVIACVDGHADGWRGCLIHPSIVEAARARRFRKEVIGVGIELKSSQARARE